MKGTEFSISSFLLINISAANYRTWLLFSQVITDASDVNGIAYYL